MRVPGQFLLIPSVSHGFKQSDERSRRRWYYPLADPCFNQSRILLQRGAEKCFTGKEHNYKFRRGFELLPIRFGAETLHVNADLASVFSQLGAANIVIRGFNRF